MYFNIGHVVDPWHKAIKKLRSPDQEFDRRNYLEFQETYTKVFNKVPPHMVASYPGISRETLSRVRTSFARKKQDHPE
jgi:hypothetical protein